MELNVFRPSNAHLQFAFKLQMFESKNIANQTHQNPVSMILKV